MTSDHDGDLILYNVDKTGKATQIFPNEAARKVTPLAAGIPMTIPDDYYGFDFEAGEAGENLLVAIVVRDAVELSDIAPASKGLSPNLDARSTIAGVVSALHRTWAGEAENRGIIWSFGTMKYSIY